MKKILTFSLVLAAVFMSMTATSARTDESAQNLQVLIEQLQQQIKDLESKIAVLKAKQLEEVKPQPVPKSQSEKPETITDKTTFTKNLSSGSSGQDVKKLQELLREVPDVYPDGPVTGYYGPRTETAVKKLQKRYDLNTVGVVGPKTRNQLNQVIEIKERMAQVKAVPVPATDAPVTKYYAAADSVADIGSPADEAFHNLVGWGAINPGLLPIVDTVTQNAVTRTSRYQTLRADNSVDLFINNPGKTHELAFMSEDGNCDDSFDVYVNGQMVYKYRSLNAYKFPLHQGIDVPGSLLPNSKVTITFKNIAQDNCGLAAIYEVRLNEGPNIKDVPTTRPEVSVIKPSVAIPVPSASASSASSIVVLSPNGGEVLTIGQNYLIKWNNPKSHRVLNINLLRDGVPVQGIVGMSVASPLSSPTSYNWLVNPKSFSGDPLPAGGNYKIRVATPDGSPFDNSVLPSDYDDSDTTFNIGGTSSIGGTPLITVVSPNGGEAWQVGQTYQILWNSENYPSSSNIQIGLRDSRYSSELGSGEETIANTTNTGSYSFTVPASLGYLSNGYLGGSGVYSIVVYASSAPGIADLSNLPFSITP